MQRPYHTIHKKDTQALAHFLSKNGQVLLPMVEPIEQSKLAVDELIDVLRRTSIEAVLRLSAEGVAGPPHLGKKGWGNSALKHHPSAGTYYLVFNNNFSLVSPKAIQASVTLRYVN